MEDLLAVRRMLELEKMAIDSDMIFPLSIQEWRYIERAEKMPYNEIVNSLNYIMKHLFFINQKKIVKELKEKYSVSEDVLNQRFEDVNRILRYQDSLNNNLLKEQKRMIKKMNK